MKTEYDYFFIEKSHLRGKSTFPFHLFIFNPKNDKYNLYLKGNHPLTKDLDSFLDVLTRLGGRLAILKKQKKTFLVSQKFEEKEIPSLNQAHLHDLEKDRIMFLKLLELYQEREGDFIFQNEFEKACETNNFEKIIHYAQLEIMSFSVKLSPTVSLASHFAKKFLIEDNQVNRIVACSYLLAKTMNISDTESLADIVCACLLANIGQLQLPLKMIRASINSFSSKDLKIYEKHTILSNHLIKKSHTHLSERCKKIIQDHHERDNGEGFPTMKAGNELEPLALIVGAITLLFEFSSGKLDGDKHSLKSLIIAIKNNQSLPGFNFCFGENISFNMGSLINTDIIKEKKIA